MTKLTSYIHSALAKLSPFAWFNLLAFNLLWLAAMNYGNQSLPLLVIGLALQFLLSPKNTTRRDIVSTISIGSVGIAIDSALSYSGLYYFHHNSLMPLWLIMVWYHFAFSLRYSFAWLRKMHPLAISLIGALAATCSYASAHFLGAVNYPYTLLLSLCVIAACWCLFLPSAIAWLNFLDSRGAYHVS